MRKQLVHVIVMRNKKQIIIALAAAIKITKIYVIAKTIMKMIAPVTVILIPLLPADADVDADANVNTKPQKYQRFYSLSEY